MVRTVVDKLVESNYEYWKDCMKSYLISEDLWDVVTGNSAQPSKDDADNYKKWREKNAKALHAIQISCSPDIFSKLHGNESAQVAWECLALKHPTARAYDREISIAGDDFHQYDDLVKAVNQSDLKKVENILMEKPDAKKAKISSRGNTLLHVAIMAGHDKKEKAEHFVERVCGHDKMDKAEHLVKTVLHLVPNDALEISNNDDHIPLHLAAILGDQETVDAMLERNVRLIEFLNKDELLPIVVAALNGPQKMVRYLYSKTPIELLHSNTGYNGATLLNCLILDGIYDLALDILRNCPKLGVEKDFYGNNALKLLSHRPSVFMSGQALHIPFWKHWIYNCIRVHEQTITHASLHDLESGHHNDQLQRSPQSVWKKRLSTLLHGIVQSLRKLIDYDHLYQKKFKHEEACKLLKTICKRLPKLCDSRLEEIGLDQAIADAVKNGIVKFIHEMIECYPDVLWRKDKNGRTIFAHAIIQRQEDIFSLVFDLGPKKRLVVLKKDIFGNNFLHLAAKLSPFQRLEHVSGAALQMQRELQWYKEIERRVPAKFKEDVNENNKTPKALFTQEHEDLQKEGEKWMKNTAASCMVVAALIAAVMFGSAFTIPGDYGENGLPRFLSHNSFILFIVSNALSLFSSSASLLMFLGILTSSYTVQDYKKALPVKLMTGLFTLFFSIITMMSTFATAIYLSVYERFPWITIPIIPFAIIPGALYLVQQFPLFVEMYRCTCGGGIFRKHRKRHGFLHLLH